MDYSRRDSEPRSNTALIIGVVVVLLVVAAIAFGLLSVKQTREAEAPRVKIEGGQAPAYDVKTADVAVGAKQVAVDVPKITMTTTKVEVPTMHVEKAK